MRLTADQAMECLNRNDTQGIEDALMTAIEDEQSDLLSWFPVLERFSKTAPPDSAETPAWAYLEVLPQRLSPLQAIKPAGEVMRWFPQSRNLREQGVRLYRAAYSDRKGIDPLLELSGLGRDKPVRRALEILELSLSIQPGTFLVGRHDPSAVRVVRVDEATWNVHVETPHGEELFDAATLSEQYEIAREREFRVMQQFDPEGLGKLVREEPVEVILDLLRLHRHELTSDQLETILTPQYLAREEFGQWWSRARSSLRKHPRIRLEGRNPVVISYQEGDLGLEEDYWKRLELQATPKKWIEVVEEYLRETKAKKMKPDEAFLQRVSQAVCQQSTDMEKERHSRRLEAWLAAGVLSRRAGSGGCDEDVLRVVDSFSSPGEAIETLSGDMFRESVIAILKQHRSDRWTETCVALLPGVQPKLADTLYDEIVAAGQADRMKELPQIILSDPVKWVHGLCWMWERVEPVVGFELPPPLTLLTRFIQVLDRTEHAKDISTERIREIRATVRSALVHNSCRRFRACLDQIDGGMAEALRSQIVRSGSLTEVARRDLMRCLNARFPTASSSASRNPWEETEVLYYTSAGLAVKEADLNELVNVKMKENAIAIGEAAARGDLSENSEYKFALEERDLLQLRVREIQNQMARSRLLTSWDVPTDHIGVGSRVEFRNVQTGEILTLTFLGPWESNTQQNILNYQAPLSQKLMGLKPGATVDLDYGETNGTFEVVNLSVGVGA